MQDISPVNEGGIVRRHARQAYATVAAVGIIMLGTVQGAFATPPDTDLTDGAGDTFFSTITSYFTGDVLPAVLVLLALMVGVGVLIKWGKRAAKSS